MEAQVRILRGVALGTVHEKEYRCVACSGVASSSDPSPLCIENDTRGAVCVRVEFTLNLCLLRAASTWASRGRG